MKYVVAGSPNPNLRKDSTHVLPAPSVRDGLACRRKNRKRDENIQICSCLCSASRRLFAADSQRFRSNSINHLLPRRTQLLGRIKRNDDGSKSRVRLPHGGHYRGPAIVLHLYPMGSKSVQAVLHEESAR